MSAKLEVIVSVDSLTMENKKNFVLYVYDRSVRKTLCTLRGTSIEYDLDNGRIRHIQMLRDHKLNGSVTVTDDMRLRIDEAAKSCFPGL